MSSMQIGSIEFQLNRKSIKNLHISVLPPDGRVRVSAPQTMTENAIRMAVISRIPWIKKQQQDFSNQTRQSEREMLNGECHYLWGRKHRLTVTERAGKHEIKLAGVNKIELLVRTHTSIENKWKVLNEFYRAELKGQVQKLLEQWQSRVGVKIDDWGVKKMKTKWGSCNTSAKRIWINLELAKKPHECLEYILVHELVHLLERHHNDRFKQHMDRLMPDWRERRSLLNSLPLAHEEWVY